MKIEFLQDVAQKEPKLVIVAADYNRDVQALSDQLERLYSKTVNGYTEERVQILSQADILRIYAEGQHVFCQTADGIYILRSRLYEMEATLDSQTFVRISKCELINKHKILRLDVSLSGTVGVILEGNVKTYTSRRYVSKIKAVFGL